MESIHRRVGTVLVQYYMSVARYSGKPLQALVCTTNVIIMVAEAVGIEIEGILSNCGIRVAQRRPKIGEQGLYSD